MDTEAENDIAPGGEASPAPKSAEQPPGAGTEAVPTIVVDPTLQQEADAWSKRNGNLSQPPASGPPAEDDPAPSQGLGDALTADEAERFAASFRPSWEPAPATATGAPSEPPAGPSEQPAAASTPAPPAGDDELPVALPGHTGSRRPLLIAGGAVIGFGLVTYLAIASSSNDAPAAVTEPVAVAEPAAVAEAPATAAVAEVSEQPSLPADAPKQPASAQPAAPSAQASVTPPSGALPAPDQPEAPSPVGPSEAAAQAPAAQAPPAQAQEAPPGQGDTLNTTAAAAQPPQAQPPAEAAEEEPRVRVDLTTVPRRARIEVDGKRVKNPYQAELDPSGNHDVRVSARGYETRSWTLSFDRDQKLTLSLSKAQVADKRPAAPKPRKRKREGRKKGAGFVAESPY